MSKVIFRFYEELNDFLPKRNRKIAFEAEFEGIRSVKDMIESLGVPHTEVDLILVNGNSVDFSYIIKEGDRIGVYPVFESLNIKGITRLRRTPLRRTRFIADINLGHIVKYLRLLGLDVYNNPGLGPKEIIAVSRKEKRIILTGSKNLLKHKDITHGMYIRPGRAKEQLKRIIDNLDLQDQVKPFSRCIRCNALLESVEKETIMHRIPPKTRQYYDAYMLCHGCNKLYWKGTHYTAIKKTIDEVLDKGDDPDSRQRWEK